MTEPTRPRRRPAPGLRPGRAAPGSSWTRPTLSGTAQPERTPSGDERPRPRPGPDPASRSTPRPGPKPHGRPSRLSRLARRQAERRSRVRRFAAVVAAVVAVLGIALFAVAATRHGHRHPVAHATKARSSEVAATSTAPSRQPTVSGASLTDPDLALSFLAGAASDLAAVTSYDYRHLDDALSVGLSVTTGAYRDAYRAALTGPVADDALAHHVVQTFRQLAAGIGEIDPDGTHAKVLVFGLQTRTDDTTGGGAHNTLVTLTATIERNGNSYLISDLGTSGSNAGLPPGSPDLTYAAEAARAEVVNTLSYTRGEFDSDLQRALDAAVDPLRSQIARTASDTKQTLNHGKYDLSGSVTAVAVQSAEGTRVELLVAATGYQISDDGTRKVFTDGRYEVSVAMVDGRWVTSGITPIEEP